MSAPWVLDLRDPACLDRRLAGGKGAGLAALVRAGLPTPPGFVVTTGAYRAAGGRAPGRLRPLAAAVMARARAIGPGPYAVRSSAAAEDGAGASWAGALETRLGVPASRLLAAIGGVWRSALRPRALAYAGARPGRAPAGPVPSGRRRDRAKRAAAGPHIDPLDVAVVVQPLAPALAAGTCLTAVPLRAATPLVVIEAVAGLGAPLVGGRLTPDRYLLDRRTGILLEARPAVQPWMLAAPGAGRRGPAARRVCLAAAAAAAPKLPRAAVRQVARLALAAERRLGRPQDVEWVWTGGGVVLVQARPLTA